jgi:hypothetical protein
MNQETRALYEQAKGHDADFMDAHQRGNPRAAYHAMDVLWAHKKARKLEHIGHAELAPLEFFVNDRLNDLTMVLRLGVYGLMGVFVLLLFIAAKLA